MKNDLLCKIALLNSPYVHRVVRDWNLVELEYRFSCICGYRSEWVHIREDWQESADHPDGVVTVSRTDLTPIRHPSNTAKQGAEQ